MSFKNRFLLYFSNCLVVQIVFYIGRLFGCFYLYFFAVFFALLNVSNFSFCYC
jgi:hypothetical protein